MDWRRTGQPRVAAHRGIGIAWLCFATACNPLGDDGDDDAATDALVTTSGSGAASTGATTAAAVDENTQSTTSGPGEPTCPDVMFSYTVTTTALQWECGDLHEGTNTCAVTQTGCTLSWGCNGTFGAYLPDGPIDAEGVYIGESDYMGMPITCTVTFGEPYSFAFECTTGGMMCTGSGF